MGLEPDYDYTPQVYRTLTFAATVCHSFGEASKALAELAELTISCQRVHRAAERIGNERVAELAEAAARYEALPRPQPSRTTRTSHPPRSVPVVRNPW